MYGLPWWPSGKEPTCQSGDTGGSVSRFYVCVCVCIHIHIYIHMYQ